MIINDYGGKSLYSTLKEYNIERSKNYIGQIELILEKIEIFNYKIIEMKFSESYCKEYLRINYILTSDYGIVFCYKNIVFYVQMSTYNNTNFCSMTCGYVNTNIFIDDNMEIFIQDFLKEFMAMTEALTKVNEPISRQAKEILQWMK